jgi:hypothetical protein
MIVSLLGLVISLFAYLLAFPEPHQRRFDVYAALMALHIIAAIGFWLLSFESGMDAFLYYRDPFRMVEEDPLASGTFFMVHFVQLIRSTLGGSFLDHFLFFQCFGMIGMAMLMRSMNEIAESLDMSVPLYVYFLLFLPGLHFWTAGIGKDGPMFMAICISIWAALKIHKRIIWMALAILIMVLIRNHVAAVAMTAIAGGLLISGHLSRKARIALSPIALIGLVVIFGQATARFGVTLDSESLGGFIEEQQDLGDRFGSGADLQSLSLPLKIWSLLFRPLFFGEGSSGMMGWAASIENSILLAICAYIAYHWKLALRLSLKVFYVSYCAMFSGALIVLLSLVNYNIGLGQRQKMMTIPAILLIAATIFLYKRYLAAQGAAALSAAAQPRESIPAQA